MRSSPTGSTLRVHAQRDERFVDAASRRMPGIFDASVSMSSCGRAVLLVQPGMPPFALRCLIRARLGVLHGWAAMTSVHFFKRSLMMKKIFCSMRVRAVLFGLVFGLAGASAWALPPGGGGGGGHVCMIDPADTGAYLSCLNWFGSSICCAIYGL